MKRLVIAGMSAALLLFGWTGGAEATASAAKVPAQASKGCQAHTKAPKGETLRKITSGGEKRTYYRFIPKAYNGKKPLPIVMDLHGHTEPVTFHKNASALGPFGNKHGFITLTPAGSGPPPKWETTPASADVQFLLDLVDEVEATLCVDLRRVFVTGYSNGAFVTSLFACQYADRFAAFAPVSGIRNPPNCTPSRPVPIIAFHGVADEWIAYNGGYGPGPYSLPPDETRELLRSGEATYSDLSIPEVTAAWAARNGCDATPTETKVTDTVTLIKYKCPDGADVELYAVDGAGHTWPGSKAMVGLKSFIGSTDLSISATALMWKFFQQHPLPKS